MCNSCGRPYEMHKAGKQGKIADPEFGKKLVDKMAKNKKH